MIEGILQFIVDVIGYVVIKFFWEKICFSIGGMIRWIIGSLFRSISGKPYYKFSEYFQLGENSQETFTNYWARLNSIIGLIILVFVGFVLVHFFINS